MGRVDVNRIVVQPSGGDFLLVGGLRIAVADLTPTVAKLSVTPLLILDENKTALVSATPLAQSPSMYGRVISQALVKPHPYPWMTEDVFDPAYCWRIERRDGVVLGFTSHDLDLTFDGVTYEARTGFTPTTVDTSDQFSVDNLDVDAALSSERITEDDLAGGVYDFSKITIYLVNWKNLSDPKLILRRGTIGRVTYSKNAFTAEVRGLMEAYQQQAGPLYQKLCRAEFGDAKCKIELAAHTYAGSVTGVVNDSTFATDVLQPAGLFDYGVLTWTSGDNKDAKCEVKTSQADGTISLYLPPTWQPVTGDTFTVTAGCDRNFSTCINKWANWVNFRGEPYIPGTDYLSGYPIRGAANVVGSVSESSRG